MSKKLIITQIIHNHKEYLASALYTQNRLLEVSLQSMEMESLLGNIYVGRVKDIVKNLNAAFIEIAPQIACYFSLENLENPIYVKKINSPKLVQGDEILVQVEKESMKTKPPKVTTNLNFTGKYLVLTTGKQNLGISKKLDKATRERLTLLLESKKNSSFGIIARTNAQYASEPELLEELHLLEKQADTILKKAPYQTCFSCVWKQKTEYLKQLDDMNLDEIDEIITDVPTVHENVQEYLSHYAKNALSKLHLYEDKLLPLEKCYSLSTKLQEATKEKVWLKSGGYLIIQPTEALTVIDVNSGKSITKKEAQEHYLKVNLEAAEEIAAQLRLRNISGIIIVDFIDMISTESKQELLKKLTDFTKFDSVPTHVVDMTKLNLVELTRKKIRKSLAEQLT